LPIRNERRTGRLQGASVFHEADDHLEVVARNHTRVEPRIPAIESQDGHLGASFAAAGIGISFSVPYAADEEQCAQKPA